MTTSPHVLASFYELMTLFKFHNICMNSIDVVNYLRIVRIVTKHGLDKLRHHYHHDSWKKVMFIMNFFCYRIRSLVISSCATLIKAYCLVTKDKKRGKGGGGGLVGWDGWQLIFKDYIELHTNQVIVSD